MNEIPSFDDFPENLQLKIIGELDVVTRIDFKQTAKRYNKLINENKFVVDKMAVNIRPKDEQRVGVYINIDQNYLSWSINFYPNLHEIRVTAKRLGKQFFIRKGKYGDLEKAERIWCNFFCFITKGMVIRDLRLSLDCELFSLPRQVTQVDVQRLNIFAKPPRAVIESVCLRWLTQFVPKWEYLKISYGLNRYDTFIQSSNPEEVSVTSLFWRDPLPILDDLPISDDQLANIGPSDLDTWDVDENVLNAMLDDLARI